MLVLVYMANCMVVKLGFQTALLHMRTVRTSKAELAKKNTASATVNLWSNNGGTLHSTHIAIQSDCQRDTSITMVSVVIAIASKLSHYHVFAQNTN